MLSPLKYNESNAINHKNIEAKPKDSSKDENISAAFHCKGSLITFSFQCKWQNEIKCFLYWNGQMIRFFGDEVETIFPRIFNMDHEDNNMDYFGTDEFKNDIDYINEKLRDRKFEAFQSSFR